MTKLYFKKQVLSKDIYYYYYDQNYNAKHFYLLFNLYYKLFKLLTYLEHITLCVCVSKSLKIFVFGSFTNGKKDFREVLDSGKSFFDIISFSRVSVLIDFSVCVFSIINIFAAG